MEANAHLSGDPSPLAEIGPCVVEPTPLLAHLSEEDYLALLDWTGRQIRADKRAHFSADLGPVLERLDLDVEAWVDNVQGYGSLFYRIAAKVQRLKELAQSLGRAWFRGHDGAQKLYAEAA